MKKRILLVGDHPLGNSGNSHMMAALLSRINFDFYEVVISATHPLPASAYAVSGAPPVNVITPRNDSDMYGLQSLLSVLEAQRFDILFMAGEDIWAYAGIFGKINTLRSQQGFVWGGLFPYDLINVRPDMVEWFNLLDFPCVYSAYAKAVLKPHVPDIKYFRPPLYNSDFFKPLPKDRKLEVRRRRFKTVRDDQFMFGFMGGNQFRKDPLRFIKAFTLVVERNPNVVMYLHCELDGVFNLYENCLSMGVNTGEIVARARGTIYSTRDMVDLYNSFDCVVNCSMQEGLSWTVVEAMLCGCPVIASSTTSQKELLYNDKKEAVALPVNMDSMGFIPIKTKYGKTWVESRHVDENHLAGQMYFASTEPEELKKCAELGLHNAISWLEGVSDINEVFAQMMQITTSFVGEKEKAVLFAQHSSAGDVLMTTRCFKEIKERHPGLPLVYMTMPQFKGIIEENPYIDEIIDWDDLLLRRYEVIYNPHGEKILPGGWNNLDVRLHDMYPYFCEVNGEEMLIIDEKVPFDVFPIISGEDYVVVHNTGGMSKYRTYPHMDYVISLAKGEGLSFVQIGGPADLSCRNVDVDLRGKLTWRQSAWVMRRARAAVVVDSFPSHLAGAVGTPAVVLFGPAPARVTGPKGENIICLEPDMLKVCDTLSHCWGEEGGCESPCINTITPFQVKDALFSVLERSVK